MDGELSPHILITHRMSFSDAAQGYELFDEKQQGCHKVVLLPGVH